jgi:protein-S-isoprenylcysteine O-methyltransferase Ste14
MNGLVVRALLAFLALPGSATVLVPWLVLWWGGGGLASRGVRLAGVMPLAIGGLLLLWCVIDFARVGRGTLAPIDPPRVLVRRGLYRLMRNPMYVAVLTILVGEALVFGSWAIAAWAAVLAAAFHLRVIWYEEPVLRRTFGPAFDEYCRTVPRWIPRRRGPRPGEGSL